MYASQQQYNHLKARYFAAIYSKCFRIQSQQLAKIYSLLRENQDQLGEMSFDDVKQQLGMYKTE